MTKKKKEMENHPYKKIRLPTPPPSIKHKDKKKYDRKKDKPIKDWELKKEGEDSEKH